MNTKTTKNSNTIFLIVILLGGFLSSLTETIMNNSLTTIMNELHVSETTAQWLSTGYIMVVGIMMPVAVYLIHRFPLRKLFPTAIALFLAGTLVGACAPNFWILLGGRLIQAVSVGITMPLVQNLMVLLFPPEKRGMAMGMSSIVIILGPALGPTLSGWIVDHYSWRMLFEFLLPLTVIILILAIIFTKNVTSQQDDQLDWMSVIESSLGLGLLLYGFSRIGSIANIDLISGICIIGGGLIIWAFVIRQLDLRKPLLEMRTFKAPSFTKTTILAAVMSIAMLGAELIIPLYLQNLRGTSALVSGLLLLPGALVMIIVSPLAGTLYDKYGIKQLSIWGFAILTLASLPMIWFSATTPLWWITFLYAVRMVGIGLVMMQLATSGVNALPERYSLHGNTVAATIRQVASSLGTSLMVTIAAIGSTVANNHHHGHLAALQAGYQDAFIAVTIIAAICLLLTFTLKNKTTPEID